jgi:hypothetical protein
VEVVSWGGSFFLFFFFSRLLCLEALFLIPGASFSLNGKLTIGKRWQKATIACAAS